MVRRTVHWFSVQSRRVKDVWQGRRDREERGRSIAAAAASSEVTIARHWADGRTDGWNGQINRADGGGLVASSPNCSTKGDDDDGDPDYQRGREGRRSLLASRLLVLFFESLFIDLYEPVQTIILVLYRINIPK